MILGRLRSAVQGTEWLAGKPIISTQVGSLCDALLMRQLLQCNGAMKGVLFATNEAALGDK